jgi:preprotein translocase subunit SecA/nephrocystin-3
MSNLIDNRQIRIFISSTFRDMQDERDYLMKRTFPKLRRLAAERDVTLTELDLRWGITAEESKSGKVVEICLREIENSIPFFIGIIGNRYGWVPKQKDLDGNVTERFSVVKDYLEHHLSVTEMEMQFGVLSREEDMHAYFYMKEQEGEQDNPEMLQRLKDEVIASKYPSTTYSSPEDLANQVEEAFINLIDTLFPEGNLSELEKERIGQRSFLNQLCQNYIKDEKNFETLDAWLADDEIRQFVITGASGLGKSALVANWLKEKLGDSGCKYNIIYHFTGNGGSESNSEHITRSLINEINDLYGWESSVDDDKLENLFLKVSSVGVKPLLIVIDAINQIIDVDNSKLLNWLPVPTRGIKILFSTLEDDRTMEVFKNRHYSIFTLQALDIERRSQLVKSYLKLYAKSLVRYGFK